MSIERDIALQYIIKYGGGVVGDVTMKVKEYAEHIKIGQGTIRRFARIDGFPVLRIGRRQLILVEKADQWIVNHAAECSTSPGGE